MRPLTVRKALWIFVLSLLIVIPAQAREASGKILAPWEGEGEVFKVGPKLYQFVGKFEGIMYIEKGDGDFDTAIFVCPTTQDIEADTLKTEANGRCHIIGAPGNVFAKFTCKGQVGSCKGKFTITGGTDDYEGITGESEMISRAAFGGLSLDTASGSAMRTATGLVVWPNMKVNIPKMK
ncbi:hypothetical protein [Kaarinaea lacus]